jgi:hypothetical protein
MFRLVRRPLTDLLEGRRIDMPMRDAASRDAASRAVEGPNVGDDGDRRRLQLRRRCVSSRDLVQPGG